MTTSRKNIIHFNYTGLDYTL